MSGWLQWLFGLDSTEVPDGATTRLDFPGIPFGNAAWTAGTIALAAIALIVVLYRAERDLPVRRRVLLGAIRIAALAVVLLMLLNPQLFTEIRLERRGQTFVLFDASRSMGEKDALDGDTRYEIEEVTGVSLFRPKSRIELVGAAVENTGLIEELEQSNRVRPFAFDRELRAAPDLNALEKPSATADGTHIGDALLGVLGETGHDPVAGVVVVSDGRPTGGAPWEQATADLVARGIPVHTVAIGKRRVPKNIAVKKLVAPETAAEGFPIRIDARVEANGLGKQRRIKVVLKRIAAGERRSSTVETRLLSLVDGATDEALTFYDNLERKGAYYYTVETTRHRDETSVRDNHRTVRVVVTDESSRVLLVAGSPTNEYRFLRNFLLRDEGLQTSIWLDSASPNVEQDGDIVVERLPQTVNELRGYDVVILLDPPSSVLTPAFAKALRKLVVERGTGLAYVAGENNTAPGELAEFAALLPVDFRSSRGGWHRQTYYERAWRPTMTPQGAAHPLCQLVDDVEENTELWQRLPGFYYFAGATKLRPAAISLLDGPEGTIALAVQRAGTGYSIFIGTDDLWRWQAGRRDDLHERFWAGVARFLALGRKLAGNQDGTLHVDRDRYDLGDDVIVEASLLDHQRKPVVKSSLALEIEFEPLVVGTPPGGALEATTAASAETRSARERPPPDRIELAPVDGRAGWYRGVLAASAAGEYSLRTEAGAEAAIRVVRMTAEMEDPSPDLYTLREIAERTGGRFLGLQDIDELSRVIPERTVTEVVGKAASTLWDSPLVLGLFCVLLIVEWVLRKYWRLH